MESCMSDIGLSLTNNTFNSRDVNNNDYTSHTKSMQLLTEDTPIVLGLKIGFVEVLCCTATSRKFISKLREYLISIWMNMDTRFTDRR